MNIRVKFESHKGKKNKNDFGLQSIVYAKLSHSNRSLCFSGIKRDYSYSSLPLETLRYNIITIWSQPNARLI